MNSNLWAKSVAAKAATAATVLCHCIVYHGSSFVISKVRTPFLKSDAAATIFLTAGFYAATI